MHASRRSLLAAILIAGLSLTACRHGENDGSHWNAATAEQEYQLLQAESKLADAQKPYLAINFQDGKLELRLKGATIWDYPMDITKDDSREVARFVERFHVDHRLVRPVTSTHLFSGKELTPDSILNIVSEVTKFKPELLQRTVPARFEVLWGDNVMLDVETGVQGKELSKLKNTLFSMRNLLQNPLGMAQLSVKMDSVHAITLYRVAQPGLPTIIYPPKPQGS